MLGTISSKQLAGLFGHLHAGAGQLPDFLRGDLAAFGQLANFGGDHRETLAVRAGARRFDCGVQGQQVGLVGDVVDDADLAGDGFHGFDRVLDCVSAFLRPVVPTTWRRSCR
jgi:hypothetical protein